MHPVLAYLQEHRDAMVADLQQVVLLESPSLDKPLVDELATHFAQAFAEVGAEVERLPLADRGDVLRLAYGPGEGQSLVLCHMDTVFAAGDLARNPLRLEDGRLYGPGACDMKGGIVIFLWALRCMKALGLQPRRRVVGLITSDEEIGSAASRTLIEEEARRSSVCLVMEPSMPSGALKTWRKGSGHYTVTIKGRPAHAGADPGKGINAAIEAAHQMLRIDALNDPAKGTSVVVGTVHGGTKSNVVPDECVMQIDNRFMDLAEGVRVRDAMRSLTPVLPGAEIEVVGDVRRAPLVRNDATVALFAEAQRLWAELNLGSLTEGGTGGVSDGNLASGVGCPTLDGLGAKGDGIHTYSEYVEVDSLPERAALLVRLLQTV